MASLEGRPIASINENDLLDLISNQVQEGKLIDYKRDLPGTRDSDRDEFLRDISSFANTSGGHIVFGMDEAGGLPTALQGIGAADPEQVKLRLEGIRESGIRPRIPGVEFHAVPLSSGSHALVVRIPKSWASPHMTDFRFWGRNSNGKYRLDVDELRSVFSVKETVMERVRAFWIDRANRVASGETAMPMTVGAKLMLGLFPMSSFDSSRALVLPRRPSLDLQMTAQHGTSWGTSYNFDGLVLWEMSGSSHSWYTQMFRSGGVEFVDGWILTQNSEPILPSTGYEMTLVDALTKLMKTVAFMGGEPPAVCMMTLVGVRGYCMSPGGKKLDRDVLMLPQVMLEDFSTPSSETLKPLFDMVWNTFGQERSLNYDQLGGWHPRR